jgi:hypothetical protein
VTIQVEDVEDHVDDRDRLHQPAHGALRSDVHAVLEKAEVGAVVLVERDYLAVEDGLARAKRASE